MTKTLDTYSRRVALLEPPADRRELGDRRLELLDARSPLTGRTTREIVDRLGRGRRKDD